MSTVISDLILAVVTTKENRDKVTGSTAVFITDDQEEQSRLCLLLSRILKGMTHDLENGVFIIVKH